jgi:hypothetical protein
MSRVAVIAGAFIAAVVLAGTAVASPIYCGPRKALLLKLTNDRDQQPSSVALTNDGQLLEVVKRDSDLAWAILITSPQGLSCIIATGDNWQNKKIDSVVQDPQM